MKGNGKKKTPAASRAAPKPINPFELKKSKTKFETVGRRIKGANKNVIKAREEAVNKRKRTLLVEYKQLRKANTFVDRRFGENDSSLTEDDKSFARLKTQRIKTSVKKLGGGKKIKFALGGEEDGEGTSLTHMGRSISEEEELMDAPELDDLDDETAEELMKDYNFGGGDGSMVKGSDGKPKTKKEVMEEIIAKSKAYKAMRQKQKEEDEEALEKLDQDYRTLLSTQALASFVKPKGYSKENKMKPDNKADAEYDVAARELAFEGKGAASDRTQSAEEIALKERKRLEVLEAERVKRMRGELNGDEDEFVVTAEPSGGYAARRAKQRAKDGGSDEGEEEDADDKEGHHEDVSGSAEEDGEDEVGDVGAGLDHRRMKRAAGNHPLQSALRGAAAQLAAKYGLGQVKNPLVEEGDEDDLEREEDEEGGEEATEDEGEEEDDEERDEENATDEGSEDVADKSKGGEAEEGDLVEYQSGKNVRKGSSMLVDMEGDAEEEDEYELELKRLHTERVSPLDAPSTSEGTSLIGHVHDTKKASNIRGLKPSLDAEELKEVGGLLDLPYTIPVPESYDIFCRLVSGRTPEEMLTAIQRIRAFNASVLASESKRKLQVFYGLVMQHFAALAGQVPIPSEHLDALVGPLLIMTSEVPFYAATVARTRLTRLNDHLTAALSGVELKKPDPKISSKHASKLLQTVATTAPGSAWPGPRALLQIKLLTTLFPTSDRRHPVLTPVVLLVGRALSQCEATSVGEAVRGLVLAGLGLHISVPGKKHFPEVVAFLSDLIASYIPYDSSSGKGSLDLPGGSHLSHKSKFIVRPGLMACQARGTALSRVSIEQVVLMDCLTWPVEVKADKPFKCSDALKLGLMRVALHAATRAVELLAESPDAFPETSHDLCMALSLLGSSLSLPSQLEEQRLLVTERIQSLVRNNLASRAPLVRSSQLQNTVAREYNPRFEDGYTKGRDYDPDRERAEQKKIKKQLSKEKRGAMRELRRDAVFMAEERDRERANVDAERMESQRKFYSELEVQAADFNSGGQGGMNAHIKRAFKRRK
ncbi:hypothetical protein CEUSTIGMA_g3604.t1 [Chlamydomonas eustigma]|uniref:Nucleolar protein 14 n=1 Tax=Chlamydomonas eustigma TaxID=1157962 RepID=A0A250X079_9CHLO|nr:hypothetical protein CEUSTIGMA_g3604.t1 [Chlamydomonas eustigma]|eukprot:GAX76160.1 hypothetical protein CEUSTIGMA_g3604.t1 [Chlamydomonas eustigma]